MITFNPSRFFPFFLCIVESVEDCRRQRRGGQTREIGNWRFRRVQKFEICAANEITWWILRSCEIPMNSPLTKANLKTCCVFSCSVWRWSTQSLSQSAAGGEIGIQWNQIFRLFRSSVSSSSNVVALQSMNRKLHWREPFNMGVRNPRI